MCLASKLGAPDEEWRMMIISGFIASRFRAVSTRVSPLVVLLAEAEILKVSALILLAAISKERRVLVLGSKKRLITVRPRKVGTFFIDREDISLNDSAVCSIRSRSSIDKSSRLIRCLCLNICSDSILNPLYHILPMENPCGRRYTPYNSLFCCGQYPLI